MRKLQHPEELGFRLCRVLAFVELGPVPLERAHTKGWDIVSNRKVQGVVDRKVREL